MSRVAALSPVRVTGVFVYPVKSLRGCAVAEADVDALGFVGDRRFLIVDAADRFLTQRTLPQMARVSTAYRQQTLTLAADRAGMVHVPVRVPPGSAKLRTVAIWKSEGLLAEDCGDEPAQWLSDVLGVACRLVRIGDVFRRPVTKPAALPGDVVAFTDAFPFMAIGEASRRDLNERLTAQGDSPVPMDRFRPSFIFSGTAPYAEDAWSRVRVGNVVLRAGGACARCIVTTTDQQTGIRAKEPLALLSTYRRDAIDPTRINFGQNFIHETKSGAIRVGDAVAPQV